jgi:hypothetical protein
MASTVWAFRRFLLIAGSFAAYSASPRYPTLAGNLTTVVEYAGDCGPGSFVQFAYSNCTYCPSGTYTNTAFGCVFSSAQLHT